MIATTTSIYFCPTRRGPTKFMNSASRLAAQADYAGNAGSSSVDGDITKGRWGSGADGVIIRHGIDLGTPADPADPESTTYTKVPLVAVKNISDGLSKTIAIGEKHMNATYCNQNQLDDNGGYIGGFQDDVVRFGSKSGPTGPIVPDPDYRGPKKLSVSGASATHIYYVPSILQFGSAHNGVVQFTLCDGSVHAISYIVDPQIFQYWCSRNDGSSAPIKTN